MKVFVAITYYEKLEISDDAASRRPSLLLIVKEPHTKIEVIAIFSSRREIGVESTGQFATGNTHPMLSDTPYTRFYVGEHTRVTGQGWMDREENPRGPHRSRIMPT